MTRSAYVGCLFGLLAAGVGCDSPATCVVGEAEGCGEGFVCAHVAEAEPQCLAPVVVEGVVRDALSGAPIEGARVLARDINGAARSGVAFSAADGTYTLGVSVRRTAEGQPESERITLRADADGYETFPKAPREALPVDIAGATETDAAWVVSDPTTDLALLATGSSGATIAGRVEHPDAGGVLVVAEIGGAAASTSITDVDGAFTLFNVPAGVVTVAGYRAGVNVTPQDVELGDADVEGVVLAATGGGLAVVRGSVSIVNAPGGLETSVILVPESTFDDVTLRGESPAGLRASPVSGEFEIVDVPPGRYAVLAGFENDQLVRDPDEGIGGTAIVYVDVAGSDLTLDTSFKVTEALVIVSPGADGLELVSETPTLRWRDDSSEDGYELRLYDAFGVLVFEDTEVPRVTGAQDVEVTLTGVSLLAGMIYQFRAYSFRDQGGRRYISGTEDLRGVFQYAP